MNGGWVGSNRRKELPKNWARLRAEVFATQGTRCVWVMSDGSLCGWPATDIDHVGDRHDHSIENLRPLCGYHHRARTSEQGNKTRKHKMSTRRREGHPSGVDIGFPGRPKRT